MIALPLYTHGLSGLSEKTSLNQFGKLAVMSLSLPHSAFQSMDDSELGFGAESGFPKHFQDTKASGM
jgi:hypothetical protein